MKVNFQQIYESIGYLFYSISSKNGGLSEERYNELHELISQRWQPVLTKNHLRTFETLHTDLIDHLRLAIRHAHENKFDSERAFDHFRTYYNQHAVCFGEDLREKMLSTAKCIARHFVSSDPASNFVHEVRQLLHVA
jgi:hypothetical protein